MITILWIVAMFISCTMCVIAGAWMGGQQERIRLLKAMHKLIDSINDPRNIEVLNRAAVLLESNALLEHDIRNFSTRFSTQSESVLHPAQVEEWNQKQ